MLPLKVEDVDIDYLQALPESGLRETNTLEFKLEIDRTERMLKEVCAFTNTFGGDLVIGVEEDEGEPATVLGVDPGELSLDNYELRLTQQIRSGIEPTVPFQIKSHCLENGNFVTHIRVGQSFIGPHRLVKTHKFCERVSTSSVEMSMENLKEAFGAVAQLQERAEIHHLQRMENHRVVGINTDRAVVFVHVIPVLSLRGQVQLPVATLPPHQLVMPPSGHHTNSRIDHLGHSLILENNSGIDYSHTGRNGIIEGAMELSPEQDDIHEGRIYWIGGHDQSLADFVQSAFEFYIQNEIAGPGFLMVSIWNARGLRGYVNRMQALRRGHEFQEAWLKCDTVFVENFEQPAREVMHRPLDIIWNGLGFQRCPGYDQEGNWIT